MSKYTEAIADVMDIICESNATKPTMVVFEQEKQSLWTAVEALQIADRLEQVNVRTNITKRLGEMQEWKRLIINEDSYSEGYKQAFADVRGDMNE